MLSGQTNFRGNAQLIFDPDPVPLPAEREFQPIQWEIRLSVDFTDYAVARQTGEFLPRIVPDVGIRLELVAAAANQPHIHESAANLELAADRSAGDGRFIPPISRRSYAPAAADRRSGPVIADDVDWSDRTAISAT